MELLRVGRYFYLFLSKPFLSDITTYLSVSTQDFGKDDILVQHTYYANKVFDSTGMWITFVGIYTKTQLNLRSTYKRVDHNKWNIGKLSI